MTTRCNLSAGTSRVRPLLFVFILLVPTTVSADTKAQATIGPPVQGNTFANAFAVLGPGTVRDGRLIAPFYGYVIGPHAIFLHVSGTGVPNSPSWRQADQYLANASSRFRQGR